MREGIYRIYRLHTDDTARTQRRLVARFVLYGETLTSLEDHDGIMESLSPNGHVNEKTMARLHSLAYSPYWEVVHEEDIQAGEHSHLLPEDNTAGPAAWPRAEG